MSILDNVEKIITPKKITEIEIPNEKASMLWHLAHNMCIKTIVGVDVKTPTKLLYISSEKNLEEAKNSPVFNGSDVCYITPEKLLKEDGDFLFDPDIVVLDAVQDHYVEVIKRNDFKKVVIISSDKNDNSVRNLPNYWGKSSHEKSFERYSKRGIRPKSVFARIKKYI